MSKDPAFLFYPGDYLRDTQMLSEKTQVAYDRIMCEHMRNICITQQQLKFLTKRLEPDELGELMMVLSEVEGGYQIDWISDSISKRKAYSESRRKNREGKVNKDMNNTSKSYEQHMEIVNENEDVVKKERKNKKSLMRNSGTTLTIIEEAFSKSDDLLYADPKYYYNSALAWSDSGGNMRIDWIATVSNFARRDMRDQKLKIKKKTRQEIEKAPDNFGVVSKTATTMPEGLKKRISNIGKTEEL